MKISKKLYLELLSKEAEECVGNWIVVKTTGWEQVGSHQTVTVIILDYKTQKFYKLHSKRKFFKFCNEYLYSSLMADENNMVQLMEVEPFIDYK